MWFSSSSSLFCFGRCSLCLMALTCGKIVEWVLLFLSFIFLLKNVLAVVLSSCLWGLKEQSDRSLYPGLFPIRPVVVVSFPHRTAKKCGWGKGGGGEEGEGEVGLLISRLCRRQNIDSAASVRVSSKIKWRVWESGLQSFLGPCGE